MVEVNKEWRLVPVVPTDDMIVAFAEGWYSKKQVIDDPDMLDAYAAMLAVAPDAPEDAQAARIAELERKCERLEAQRAEQWALCREYEASCDTKSAVIAELRAELEAFRKDAERYQWLRDQHNEIEGTRWFAEYQDGTGWVSLDKVVLGDDREVDFDLDAAIDAAMQEGGV